MIKSHAFFWFSIFFLVGCVEYEKPGYSPHSSFSNLHFDGISIGDSLNQVTRLLSDFQISSEDEVVFKKNPDENLPLKYDGYLVFDNQILYEITIDFQLSEDSLVHDFFMECKHSLDQVYGVSEMDEGYAHWSTGSINDKVIEIELFNEYLNSQDATVTVQFFEDFEKQFYAE